MKAIECDCGRNGGNWRIKSESKSKLTLTSAPSSVAGIVVAVSSATAAVEQSPLVSGATSSIEGMASTAPFSTAYKVRKRVIKRVSRMHHRRNQKSFDNLPLWQQ